MILWGCPERPQLSPDEQCVQEAYAYASVPDEGWQRRWAAFYDMCRPAPVGPKLHDVPPSTIHAREVIDLTRPGRKGLLRPKP